MTLFFTPAQFESLLNFQMSPPTGNSALGGALGSVIGYLGGEVSRFFVPNHSQNRPLNRGMRQSKPALFALAVRSSLRLFPFGDLRMLRQSTIGHIVNIAEKKLALLTQCAYKGRGTTTLRAAIMARTVLQ